MNDRALRVLDQYELEIISTRRGRGSYICETSQGLRILSDYSGSENKALFQNCIMDQLRSRGYEKVDRILPNKEGNLVSKDWEENKYVVKEWYVGRECDTSSENEILAAVGNLARLHRLMQLEGEETFRRSFTAQPPLAELHDHNAQLRKIRRFVRNKNSKGEFERLLLSSFAMYYEQAQEAEAKLAAEGELFARGLRPADGWDQPMEISPKCQRYMGGVCHGDYNQHHVLMSGYDIATTNFECCRFDFQINDLYRFMRKILEKHDWNQRLGMRMLDRYTIERPISQEERRLLYVRLLYPEKFRKLASQYYSGNKAWISGRFMEKLEMQNQQEKKKSEFVRLLE